MPPPCLVLVGLVGDLAIVASTLDFHLRGVTRNLCHY